MPAPATKSASSSRAQAARSVSGSQCRQGSSSLGRVGSYLKLRVGADRLAERCRAAGPHLRQNSTGLRGMRILHAVKPVGTTRPSAPSAPSSTAGTGLTSRADQPGRSACPDLVAAGRTG